MGLQNSQKCILVELNGVGLIPMFLSSGLEAILCPEMTSSVARLMPAYSFGWHSKPFRYLE